ncbi:MAG: cytochrome d ubiquinol oxidase subunit II [Bdellovibrionia bacterium]
MSLLLFSILTFLGISILFYVLFAGADFGAGILELFLGQKLPQSQRKLISRAMAPVWEANHVWLILAVVILFVGFPRIYTTISIYLHLPLIAILLGIVGRGCAFTFRYYDTLGTIYHRTYSRVFAGSSLWTSFFLGTLVGAMTLGRIDPTAQDFYTLYITPWLNEFCTALGLFVCALFAFLAAVYLMGEAEETELRNIFKKRAIRSGLAAVVLGVIVFLSAEFDGLPLARDFFHHPTSIGSFIGATCLWFPFWKNLSHGKHLMRTRIIGAAIVTLVLLGWLAVQFPLAIHFSSGSQVTSGITFQEAAAPPATLRALLWALVSGALLIFPALGYLLKIFKWQIVEKE